MPELQDIMEQAGAGFIGFGDVASGGVPIVESFEHYELEYAAIRGRVGILHLPQRGVIQLTGADVKGFLHPLVTQDINGMVGGATKRSFQLNQKGRIVADLIVHHGDTSTWLETDVFDIPPLLELLESRLFAEDVIFENCSEQLVCFALHGPATLPLLEAVATGDEATHPQRMVNTPGTHHVLTIAGARVSCYRWDDCGVLGVRLFVPVEKAAEIYSVLLDAVGFDADAPDPVERPEAAATAAQQRRATLRGRPVGWLAYNTARIEAGSPLFHIDFGADSIPGETGLLDEAVSFTKGCYLGQEIVARMKSLGHPKRMLAGIRFEGDALPVAGTPLQEPATDGEPENSGKIIGAVTSSTVSPILGHVPIALAVMKWGKHRPDTPLVALAETTMAKGRVGPIGFMEPQTNTGAL